LGAKFIESSQEGLWFRQAQPTKTAPEFAEGAFKIEAEVWPSESTSESPALAVAQQLKLLTPMENKLGFILDLSKPKLAKEQETLCKPLSLMTNCG
jgi:hypothetical protein